MPRSGRSRSLKPAVHERRRDLRSAWPDRPRSPGRDRRGLHPDDLDALAAGEPRDRAEHREPVVAVRVDRPAAQAAGAAHREPVGGRLDVGAEARAARRRRSRCGRTPSAAAPARPRRPSRPRRSSPSSATSGSSSIASGTSSGVTRVPTSGPWATSSSHSGSASGAASLAPLELADHARRPCARGSGRSRRGSSSRPCPRSRCASRGRAPRRRRGTRPTTGRRGRGSPPAPARPGR